MPREARLRGVPPTQFAQRPALRTSELPLGGETSDVEEISADEGVVEELMEDVEDEEGDEEEEDGAELEKLEPFDVSHLKEIGNLASWTVSTCKPGCGVEALRSEDTNLFWQSDGPQPHLLNIHFFKLVSITHIRLYLDFENDESYTPTKMSFLAGTGQHDLQEFVELAFEQPKGWIDVDLTGVGGTDGDEEYGDSQGEEEERRRGRGMEQGGGNILRAFLVQVRVAENHQNGKDTHVRGLQIFARDKGDGARRIVVGEDGARSNAVLGGGGERRVMDGVVGLEEPPWMRDPELR
ncbi:MAG: anaphase promoting complex subunit doc1 [Pycnora praestabilis]|nr:MAG: anaphase promoting complex subunit doc1 [Pycnora praestabilis]